MLAGTQGEGGYNVSIYTGSKPKQRRTFIFQGLIVSADEPAWVEAQYLKESLGIPLHGMLVIGALVLCGVIWRLRIGSRVRRVGIIMACALVILGVRTLSEGAYQTYMTTVLVTGLAAAVCLFLYVIGAWVRQTWTLWHASRQEAETQQQAES